MNFKELENVNNKSTKNNTSNDGRLRQCKTDPEASDVSIRLSKNAEKVASKHGDRDAFGSVGICQKGIYNILKNPLPVYERSYYSKAG